MEKLIITVAPTGSIPKKENTPHVPILPDEIIKTGILCEKEGASIIHIHARNPDDETPSTDYGLFKEIVKGLKQETRLIIQISTGGRAGMGLEERRARLRLKPEMASLTTGSVNFPNSVYANSPELIRGLAQDMKQYGIKPEMEVFDVSMVNNALDLAKDALVDTPIHFNFVMGLKGAIPASVDHLVFLKNQIPSDATFCVSGIGAAQLPMCIHSIAMGGHARVGLEDCIYFRKGEKATNEQLVRRIANAARLMEREIATPDDARRILGLGN